MKIDVKSDLSATVAAAIANKGSRVETALAYQVRKDTEQFVPMVTGSLKNRTKVEGNTVIYPGPYARYLYYGKYMVDSVTGRGPFHFKDEYGNEYIRYRKGAKLRATDRDLVFTTDFHPEAQAHWFEASKARNMRKWEAVAQKAAAMN